MDLNSIKETVAGKAREFMGSEAQSDAVLDKAADLANKVTGGKYAEKVESARAEADKRLGDADAGSATNPEDPQ